STPPRPAHGPIARQDPRHRPRPPGKGTGPSQARTSLTGAQPLLDGAIEHRITVLTGLRSLGITRPITAITPRRGFAHCAKGSFMRPFSLLSCFLAWGCITFPSLARSEEKPTPCSLRYTHAGLTEITIKDGKLRYVWHTVRHQDGDLSPQPGTFDAYDRHQID